MLAVDHPVFNIRDLVSVRAFIHYGALSQQNVEAVLGRTDESFLLETEEKSVLESVEGSDHCRLPLKGNRA